jgi:hypothetical protein
MKNGKIEYENGITKWYRNDMLHRDDGPAVTYADGYKAWYQNGKRHREDGPSIIFSSPEDSPVAWYLNDKPVKDVEEFVKLVKITNTEEFVTQWKGKCAKDFKV